jgi:outer membrane protein assembly factor BamB
LACYDLQGNLVWYRAIAVDRPKLGNDVGMGASPIVMNGVVVIQADCQSDAFCMGLDAKTGETRWTVVRPNNINWSSPLGILLPGGKAAAILTCGYSLMAIEIDTGKELWNLPVSCSVISSAVADGSQLYVPTEGLAAFSLSQNDNPPVKMWESNRASTDNASPVPFDTGVYTLKGSVLVRSDKTNGKMVWQLRLPEGGTFWATPIIARDRMYLFSEEGKCFIVQLGNERGNLLGTSELGEQVFGSPAIDDNAMYVRTISGVWKISKS